MSLNQYRIFGGALLALMLAGCDPSKPANTPLSTQPQATAPTLPAQPQTVAQTPSAPQPSPQQGKVQQLIAQVEKAYSQGDANYKKGRLVEAKADFDRAVDLMLTSGIDIKNTPQLQDEFDRIIDQVNGLEMEALKLGNGFAPKVEPSPADVASDVTFEVDPNIVAKAKTELATTKSDLPLMVNEYVAAFINFFAYSQKGHNTLLHSFQRYGRYKGMIERVMAEEGVPHDLIYLAVAESSFQPRAINAKSRAGGMWQFMPYGDYGLKRNGYIDERFDPEKSTRAYARYMKFLYDQLGDWYLAMAAYDWGAGNVQRAVQKTGYADFWELYKRHNLPAETQNYVPEILAAIIIANHPTQYGFDEVTLDPPVITDTVTINYAVDLRLVSDLVDAPVDELMALNPSLLRMATPPDSAFDLHLPAGTAALFEQRVAGIPESKRTAWRYHRVTPDDTLSSVAHAYHVTVADLAEANEMREDQSLQGTEALVVPVAPVAAPSMRTLLYTTRRGDTLVSIADRFGVSLDQLRRWNKIPAGLRVEPGRRLHVAEPAMLQRASGSQRHRGAQTAKSRGGTSAKNSSHSHRAMTAADRNGTRKTQATSSGASGGASSKASSKKSAHAASTQGLYAKRQK
jgi:membrane-bound lytic murein transglycosylase D